MSDSAEKENVDEESWSAFSESLMIGGCCDEECVLRCELCGCVIGCEELECSE